MLGIFDRAFTLRKEICLPFFKLGRLDLTHPKEDSVVSFKGKSCGRIEGSLSDLNSL
jgi:hypothetical protein